MPPYHARLAGLVEEVGEVKPKGLGAAELAQVAEAAVSRRIATRLIEANRQIPGWIEDATGFCRKFRFWGQNPKMDLQDGS
jgi:hypothetical protein